MSANCCLSKPSCRRGLLICAKMKIVPMCVWVCLCGVWACVYVFTPIACLYRRGCIRQSAHLSLHAPGHSEGVCVVGGGMILERAHSQVRVLYEWKKESMLERTGHTNTVFINISSLLLPLFTSLYFTASFSSHKNAALMMCLIYVHMYSVKYIVTPVDSRANCLLRIVLEMFALFYNYWIERQ